jgi:catechol 2,3-dioxygenase-like lactoylglutathione lyase family enzyme
MSCVRRPATVRVAVIVAGMTAALAGEAPAQTPVNPLGLKAHHITASVADLDRAVRWYQEMLGFTLKERGSRQNGAFQFAELEIPGFGVALVRTGATTATPAAPVAAGAPAWVHIVFSVPDPARTYATLKERGAKVTTRANPGPIQTFLVHDSEGNEIEIVAAS